MTPTAEHAPSSPAAALKITGARVAEVAELVTVHGGDPYLVGSLAAGLGDPRSDIDVHVVGDDPPVADGPMLAFTDEGACIDIRHVRRRTLERLLAQTRPVPRADAWLISNWLNAMPLTDGVPPLLDGDQRGRAGEVLRTSLVADLIALSAFACLAEAAGAPNSWHLCRRAGVVAWELAAVLTGHDYIGERWLPARTTSPEVAALADVAAQVEGAAELGGLLERLGLPPDDIGERVSLHQDPQAERWNLLGRPQLLIDARRLVPAVEPLHPNVAEALRGDPAGVFAGLVGGALRWSVDVDGLDARLVAVR